MLPQILHSSYKTYKEDTKAIATWLAVNAKKCGYSDDLLDRLGAANSAKVAQAPPRLKGKARKKAQNAVNEASSTNSAPTAVPSGSETPTYIIKVKEFVSLAEYIVACTKPLVQVPTSLVNALDRAILLRKNFGSETGASNVSDEGHAYFRGILEKTREVLKPRSPSETINDRLTKPISNTDASDVAQSEEVQNIFDKLDLQEPSQEFLDSPNVVPSTQARKERQPDYEVETLQTKEEEYLAAHCLLEDVRHIRKVLCALWGNYREGMDLVAISITVNTAIDSVRTLEQDLVNRFPAKGDYEEMIKLFFGLQCVHRGQDPNHRQRRDDLFNMAVYDLLEDIMLPTYSTLSSLQDIIQSGSVPQYKPGYFGYRDTRIPWSQKSPRDKIHDDRLVLLEAFPDLVLLSMITSKSPLAEDELMRGVRAMSPGKDIPLWLVFAAQCFLDAQHELKEAISNGHDQLKSSANSIKASIEENLKFHESLRIVNWPKSNDIQFTEMLRVINEWVGKDAVAEKWKKVTSSLIFGFSEVF